MTRAREMVAGVNPVTLAGLRCELRGGRHRAGVACGPLQDRMDDMAVEISSRYRTKDIGAIGLIQRLRVGETRRKIIEELW